MQEQMTIARDDYNDLLRRSAARRLALMKARDKLEVYRANSDGQYQGGMEHVSLLRLIDEAIG